MINRWQSGLACTVAHHATIAGCVIKMAATQKVKNTTNQNGTDI